MIFPASSCILVITMCFFILQTTIDNHHHIDYKSNLLLTNGGQIERRGLATDVMGFAPCFFLY